VGGVDHCTYLKKNDKTDCSNCRGISLLSVNYKMLSNIWPSRLTPYAEKIFGDHQCELRRNVSTTDHIFCIRQILEKNWNKMKQCISLFIDFKRAYETHANELSKPEFTPHHRKKKRKYILHHFHHYKTATRYATTFLHYFHPPEENEGPQSTHCTSY